MEKSRFETASRKDAEAVAAISEDLITQAFDRMIAVLADPEKITHASTFMLTSAFARYLSTHQALAAMAVKITGDEEIGKEMLDTMLEMVKAQLTNYGEMAERILKGDLKDGN